MAIRNTNWEASTVGHILSFVSISRYMGRAARLVGVVHGTNLIYYIHYCNHNLHKLNNERSQAAMHSTYIYPGH